MSRMEKNRARTRWKTAGRNEGRAVRRPQQSGATRRGQGPRVCPPNGKALGDRRRTSASSVTRRRKSESKLLTNQNLATWP